MESININGGKHYTDISMIIEGFRGCDQYHSMSVFVTEGIAYDVHLNSRLTSPMVKLQWTCRRKQAVSQTSRGRVSMNRLIDKLHVCRDNFGTPSISDGVRYYNPSDGGFQCEGYGKWDRRHIALTSYEEFGSNYPRNVEAARHWEELAAEAWPVLFSEQALEEYDRACEQTRRHRR